MSMWSLADNTAEREKHRSQKQLEQTMRANCERSIQLGMGTDVAPKATWNLHHLDGHIPALFGCLKTCT